MTKATKQLSKANRPAQHGPYRCDRLQMPNTINATNPMPTNSTTSATESYSSQCRLPENMTFHPCFKWTARIGRQLPPGAQAVFRRRHQPRRPPPAKIRPDRPAPAMGLLLARLLSENQALILDMLDWK